MYANYFGTAWGRYLPYLGMVPALVLYALFGVGPSLATVVFSLTNVTGVSGAPWNWVGLNNYTDFLFGGNARDNQDILIRTAIFCVAVTAIQNGLALFLAVLLNARPKGHLFYRSVFFMPTVLGVTIVGLIWTLFFYVDGPADKLASALNIRTSFLTDNTSGFGWVIFVQIWQNLGFSIVIFLAGLQTISAELYQAATIDGGTRWQLFRFITVPLLAASVTVNVLLAVIGSLQTYQLIYVLTAGAHNTSTLAYAVYNIGFRGGGSGSSTLLGYASAVSMIQFVFVLIVVLIVQWYLRRRENAAL